MAETGLGALIGRTFQLVRANAAVAAGAALLLTGAATVLDVVFSGSTFALTNIPLTIALLCTLSVVTRSAMAKADILIEDTDLRFFELFGIGFLSNVGIILGALLLVLPGVYLAARWFVAVPVLFDESRSVTDSLRSSWDVTREHAWPLVGLTLLLYVPPMALAVLVAAFEPVLTAVGVSVATNLIIYTMVVTGWHAAVAVYTTLRTPAGQLEQVFA